MQWMTIFKKEMTESARNFKWIWLPISFILLGIMDPLSNYYMPKILDTVGGLPEGAVIEIPVPPASDVFMMSVGEFNSIGLLIIILMSMNLIAGEMKSGVAELILVKPVKFTNYVTAKWASTFVITIVSFIASMLASWYYVELLFDPISFVNILLVILFYGIWLLFVITVSVFVNTLFKSPGLVGFISIIIIIILNIFTSIFKHVISWSPSQIFDYLNVILKTDAIPQQMWGAVAVTIVLIIALLFSSIQILSKKEL